MGKTDEFEIRLVDFTEDSTDDAAFAIRCEVFGPRHEFEAFRVSFTDEFINDYFKIRWNRNLKNEEHRLVTGKRELFVRWAVVKIEQSIDRGMKDNIMVITHRDVDWARKVESGAIVRVSRPQDNNISFNYLPRKK